MKNFVKSLSSLSGGDDSIFAIIDDRFDVWMQEVKDSEGKVVESKLCGNLIQIPQFYYWEIPTNIRIESFKKEILNVAREYDLDMSLYYHSKFLERVHFEFFKEYDLNPDASIKPAIKHCFKNVFNSNYLALFEFLFKGDKFYSLSELKRTYEGSKCQEFGLKYSNELSYSPSA
jgi:hypothetical protein